MITHRWQFQLRRYGHVLQKDSDWMKKCIEYEVERARPRGRPKKTWRDIVEKDCQVRKLNKEVAMEEKMEEADKGWLMTTIVPAHPGCPGQSLESRKMEYAVLAVPIVMSACTTNVFYV